MRASRAAFTYQLATQFDVPESRSQRAENGPTLHRGRSSIILPTAAAGRPHREALDATVAQAASDDEFCQSSGAQPGTQSYLHCRANFSKQREATTPPKVGR